ncbi:MAG: PQQ-dependent sugar dehydrogenase, partial [Bryobacteraceae bacterium]
PDGKLYVGVGENATSSNSQTLTNRLGKILRINSDGTIPTDNPYSAQATGANLAIWAIGLRNPYTFAFQPGASRMFINDVGQSTWEEINDGIAGSNYGWPTTEGLTANPAFRSPLFAYGHGSTSTTGCAIVGGAFYNPSVVQFPIQYVGLYFFADLCSGWVRKFDPATNLASDFASGFSSPVDLKVGPDGALYVLSAGSGLVTRIVLNQAGNQAPHVGGVNPASGSGVNTVFTFSFTDADGQQDLSVLNVLINSALDGRQACYLAFVPTSGALYLVNDTGTQLLPGITLASAVTDLANSQCTVHSAGSSAVNGANGLITLTLNVSFSAAFAGNKLVYAAAVDSVGHNTGWQPIGVWNIPGAASTTTTMISSLNPAAIQGTSQPINVTVTDSKGYQDLGVINVLINDALDGRHACFLAYVPAIHTLYLVNDAGDALLPGLVLNGSGSVSNSQCSIAGATSASSGAGTSLQLTLGISMTPSFAGNRTIYTAARDTTEGNNTGWQAVGAWMVP